MLIVIAAHCDYCCPEYPSTQWVWLHIQRKKRYPKLRMEARSIFLIRCNKYSLDSPETFCLIKLWKLNPNVFPLNLKSEVILTEWKTYCL